MLSYKTIVPLFVACVAILPACGGGSSSSNGGDNSVGSITGSTGGSTSSSDPQVAPSFALRAGYKSLLSSASVQTLRISGTCVGTATVSRSAPIASTFEGVAAIAVTDTATLNFTNCTPSSTASTSTGYFDGNYNPLGEVTVGIEYGVFVPVPAPLPASVKVGDTALVGTLSLYTDGTKRLGAGQRTTSFVIEADGMSATTAVANLISKEFNAANQLLSTEQARYRIATDGKMTFISSDVQYSTTGTNHLVLTPS